MTRPDRQRPELVEREAAHREWLVTYSIRSSFASLSGSVDSFQVRVRWKEMWRSRRIRRSRSRPTRTAGRGVGARWAASFRTLHCVNGWPELLGSGGGRRDDERDVLVTDQAGTASRPLRVQRGQPPLVERVDHVADGVLVRGDQPGDRRDRGPRRGRHDDRGPADPDRACRARGARSGQRLALLIGSAAALAPALPSALPALNSRHHDIECPAPPAMAQRHITRPR